MKRPSNAKAWAEQLAARLDPADLERMTRTMMASIDQATGARWEAAVLRAAALPGDVRPEKLRALTNSFARELAAFGAGAGAAAAAPAIGTAGTMLAATAELAWFTGRAGDLVLTVAALHGRSAPTVDERRAWVLAVLIWGGSAREGFSKTVHQATTGLSLPAGTTRLPIATLQTVNRMMTRRLVQRYGTRRGVIALGTALPLGIGAVVGGSANYVAVRALARNADSFFARLPYSAIDTTAVDVAGSLPTAG